MRKSGVKLPEVRVSRPWPCATEPGLAVRCRRPSFFSFSYFFLFRPYRLTTFDRKNHKLAGLSASRRIKYGYHSVPYGTYTRTA